jgi:O-methyltransferase
VRYLSFDELYVSLVVSRRSTWDSFRARHRRLFRCLYVGYRAYRWFRGLHYYRLYSRFADFTMIPRRGFVTNLALCEQFRHIEGAVVECGTWRGGMIAGIAALFNDKRDYFLFDSFEGLPPANEVDTTRSGLSAKALQDTDYHNCRADESSAREAMARSGARNVHVVKGWFNRTLPKYTGEPIAILRADGDWYESTMDILENLYPHVVRGGLIIFDDYYYWDGCARAVHDFLSKHELKDKIYQCDDLYAYIVKQ